MLKPDFLQNFICTAREFDVSDGCVWMSNDRLRSIICYDIENETAKLTALWPEEVLSDGSPFLSCRKIGDEIWLFPGFADDIYIYDLTQKKYDKLNIPFVEVMGDDYHKRKSGAHIQVGNELYYYNCLPDTLFKIDILSKRYEMYDLTKHSFADCDDLKENRIAGQYAMQQHGDKLFIPPYIRNIALIFDIKTNECNLEVINAIPKKTSFIT